jgi:hypothetical protein
MVMKRYLFAIFCLFALLPSCEEINVPEDKPDTPEKPSDPASPRGSDYLYDISVVSEVRPFGWGSSIPRNSETNASDRNTYL